MNVARKSTTKLPRNWDQAQKLQSNEDEADSGVASTDSTDSFQDALLNLKALSGTGDSESDHIDRSELKDLQTTTAFGKVQNGKKTKTGSSPKENPDEEEILEQIDEIVNDEKETLDKSENTNNDVYTQNKKSENHPKADNGSRDKILIKRESEVEVKSTDKKFNESIVQKDDEVNNKSVSSTTSAKSSLRIGDKVRSTVHNLMSKLVQSNPDVNNLLSKTKAEDCTDSRSSGTASPLQAQRDKGNLFDKFDVPERDHSSLNDDENGENPQLPCIDKQDGHFPESVADVSKLSRNDEGSIAEMTKQSDTAGENHSLHTCVRGSIPLDIKKCDVKDHCPEPEPSDVSRSLCSYSDETAICYNSELSSSNLKESKLLLGNSSDDTTLESNDSTENAYKTQKCTSLDHEKYSKPELSSMESEVKSPTETTGSINETVKNVPLCKLNSSKEKFDDDRKRQHEDEDKESEDCQPPKRSRLDEVIGKLGERVPYPESVQESDMFDDDSTPGDTDSGEKQSDEEDDKHLSDSKTKAKKISLQELEALIEASAKASHQHFQSSEILALTQRVEELMKSEEEWRQKAKALEKQVLDLTVLQQRLEKRKAHTAALKSITTRSIGVWVTEDKLKSGTPQKIVGNRTPPTTPVTAQPSLLWTQTSQARPTTTVSSHAIVISNSGITSTQGTPSRNTSVAHLLSQTARLPTVASCSAASKLTTAKVTNTGARFPLSLASLTGTANVVSSVNPLSRNAVTGSTTSASNFVFVSTVPGAPPAKPTAQGNTTQLVTPAGSNQVKFIDLTMEDDNGTTKQLGKTGASDTVPAHVPKQVMRQVTPVPQTVPAGVSSAIILNTPAGTQIVNPGNLARSGVLQPVQVVTIANPQSFRQASILTVMPGQTGSVVQQAAPTFTTSARDSAPLVMAQQLPAGVTFVRPSSTILGSGTIVRPTTPSGISAPSVTTSVRMPLTVTHTPASASGPAVGQLNIPKDTMMASAKKISHPAPLPPAVMPRSLPAGLKPLPPRPGLKISRVKQGIVLSWNMNVPTDCSDISSYQLFAYQESPAVPQTSLWKKVGDVKALALPMACTLTQFQDGNKYHFAVRAMDVHGRSGPFSEPSFIYLTKAA